MFLAMKEMRHNKLRFLMIGIIFVMISWLVFILSGLGNGLSTLAAATVKNMDADYVVFEQGSRASMSRSLISDDLIVELEQMPGVASAAPMGSTMATAMKNSGTVSNEDKLDISIIGIIPGSFLEPSTIEGKGLSSDRQSEVIVNDTLKDHGYKVGDTLVLDGSTETLTIAGFVENQTYNHVAAVFTPIEKWRTITFAAPGSDRGVEGPVNAIMLQGNKINAEEIDAAISHIETVTKSAAVQGMPGYKEENGTIMMMLAFLLAISAFVIGVYFYVFTMQKTNQFGIMKAMGATNGFLGRAIVSQVFILSLVSIVAGVLLTYGTAAIMPEGMPFMLDIKLVLVYSSVLLVFSILSSLISVRKIAKIDPLKALGRVE